MGYCNRSKSFDFGCVQTLMVIVWGGR